MLENKERNYNFWENRNQKKQEREREACSS